MVSLLEIALDGKRYSRDYFLRHLAGLTDADWHFKPFPEVKTIAETLQHMIVDDLSALESLETGADPEYDAYEPETGTPEQLLARLAETHAQLLQAIARRFPDPAPDTKICIWGDLKPFVSGVGWLSSEDCYHAGQVALLRMAKDPKWDYYLTVYGQSYDNCIGSESSGG